MHTRPGFIEIKALRHAGSGIGLRGRSRSFVWHLRLRRSRRIARIASIGVARPTLREPQRALLLLKLESSASGFRAPGQSRIVYSTGFRAIELGEQRPTRIRGDCSDRPRTWTKTEAVQRNASFKLGINGHALLLLSVNARRPQTWFGMAVSILRRDTFPDDDGDMKIWKGLQAPLNGG
jgi:hypothetical protein